MKKKLILIVLISAIVLLISCLFFFSESINFSKLNPFSQKEIISSAELIEENNDTKEEFLELLIKTSDNVLSKSDRKDWTQEMLEEERRGNSKQGYVIQVRPAGWNWGNLEKDPKRFAIVKIPIEEWNASWLEPEYDYSNPIYDGKEIIGY